MPRPGTRLEGRPGQVEKPQSTRRGQLNSHGCVLLFQASPSPIIVNTDTLEPSLSVSLPPLLASLPPPEGLAHFLLGCPLGGLCCPEPKAGVGLIAGKGLSSSGPAGSWRGWPKEAPWGIRPWAGSLAQFLPAETICLSVVVPRPEGLASSP